MTSGRNPYLVSAYACVLFLSHMICTGAFAQASEIDTRVASAVPGSDTQTGNGETRSGIVSGDGRYVVFTSTSTNLGFTDTNNTSVFGTDLFLRDLETGDLTLVTHAAGQPTTTANSLFSFAYDISSDGRYVVYNSQGTNVVDGQNDLNGPPDGLAEATDLFVFDRMSGGSSLVSHAFGSSSTTGDRSSNIASMSGDGRFIAFESQATNLVEDFVEGNSESEPDVYVYEIATGDVSLISHAAGDPASGSEEASRSAKMSDDGRYVVFESMSGDLVTGFTDADPETPTNHVYIHDRMTGETRLVSHATGSSTTGGDAFSGNAEISGNGEFVTFRSEATDLVTGYVASDGPQIFVYERTTGDISLISHIPGQVTVASNGFSGNSWISEDGRWVVHSTGATDLVSGQIDMNDVSDLFMYDRSDRTTTIVSHAAGSETTTGDGFAAFADMSTDGRFVAYRSPSTNLVEGQVDANGGSVLGADAFLWDRLTGESILLSNVAGSPTTADATAHADTRSMSDDGTAVLFSSVGTDYVAGQSDTNNEEDVFVSLIDTTPPPPPGCDLLVTTTADAGAGSMRQVLLDANAAAGEDTICFAIEGDGPHTIQPLSELPRITDPVVIDGLSQSGASCAAWPPQLMIQIDGSAGGTQTAGLFFDQGSSGSTARGLVVRGMFAPDLSAGHGIVFHSDANRLECSFVGTDASGTLDAGNTGVGIFIIDSSDNLIGGTDPSKRNLISGNGAPAIQVETSHTDGVGKTADVRYPIGRQLVRQSDATAKANLVTTATGNRIEGNFIGTDVTGMQAIGNNLGILNYDALDTQIGGAEAGSGNLLSGNDFAGVWLLSTIDGETSTATLRRNLIGVDATGLAALENGLDGVLIDNASANVIGGDQPGDGNVISGNDDDGVDIFGTEGTSNIVRGNLIGVGSDGRTPVGNDEDGIDLNGEPSFNEISDNVLSANGEWGVYINTGASDNRLYRNYVGTNAEGDELGNALGGILVEDAGPQIIGGTYTMDGECCEGNTIAYNGGPGVGVDVTVAISHEKGIRGNRIFANEGLGIDLELDGVTANDPQDADGAGQANALQNYPVLDVPQAGQTQLAGMLNSVPSSSFQVDVYRSSVCDPSGYGEGEFFLGTVDVTTDASGDAPITFDLGVQVGPNEFYTATAIDAQANTSEFSACVEAEFVDAPPSASEITAPADGATVVVGGAGPDDAGAPNDMIAVSWTASVDPEGSDVMHTWQLAATDDFSTLLLEVDAGADTEISFTLAELAAVLDGAGVAPGTGASVYHRVISGDGASQTIGPAAEVTLVRGTLVGVGDINEMPVTFALRAAYPNPFNPSTTIGYALPESGHVRLSVFDLLGREVRVLVDGMRPSGDHRVVFEAATLPSGIYLIRVEAGGRALVRQVTLMK